MDRDAMGKRRARLGAEMIQFEGTMPQVGERLNASFRLPAARHAEDSLTATEFSEGLVIVSTLPNIQKHACIAQIVDLEEQTHETLPNVRIVHVSADHKEHRREVDRFHPNVQATGYSLCCADAESREAFVNAFGVGVEDHHRITHGLFALQDGIFLATNVPDDQVRPAEVKSFLYQLVRLLAGVGQTTLRAAR